MIQKATDIENENAKKKTQSQNVIKAVVLKAKVDKRNSSPIAAVSCFVKHELVSFFSTSVELESQNVCLFVCEFVCLSANFGAA